MTDRLSEPAVTKPVVPLAVGQVLALEAAMPARWRAMVSLGAATGPRVSEALGLTVNRIGLTGTGDVGRRKPGLQSRLAAVVVGVNAHTMLTDCA